MMQSLHLPITRAWDEGVKLSAVRPIPRCQVPTHKLVRKPKYVFVRCVWSRCSFTMCGSSSRQCNVWFCCNNHGPSCHTHAPHDDISEVIHMRTLLTRNSHNVWSSKCSLTDNDVQMEKLSMLSRSEWRWSANIPPSCNTNSKSPTDHWSSSFSHRRLSTHCASDRLIWF